MRMFTPADMIAFMTPRTAAAQERMAHVERVDGWVEEAGRVAAWRHRWNAESSERVGAHGVRSRAVIDIHELHLSFRQRSVGYAIVHSARKARRLAGIGALSRGARNARSARCGRSGSRW